MFTVSAIEKAFKGYLVIALSLSSQDGGDRLHVLDPKDVILKM